MITVPVRREGTTAVITIPEEVLKSLNIEVGSTLALEVANGAVTARPARKRYSLAELLQGATPDDLAALATETEWAREGEPVGRELA